MQRTVLFLALFLTAATALAQDKPQQRKSGLWELKRTSTITHGQARVYQMCIDQKSDNALTPLAEGMPGESCETSNVRRAGEKLTLDAVCKIRGTTTVATAHVVITGSFDSAYKIESQSTLDPPLKGNTKSTATVEAKWTGACKPDQKAGDVILPYGAKTNIASEEKARAARAPREEGAPEGEKSRRKKGYLPAPAPAGAPATPAVPPPGTTTK